MMKNLYTSKPATNNPSLAMGVSYQFTKKQKFMKKALLPSKVFALAFIFTTFFAGFVFAQYPSSATGTYNVTTSGNDVIYTFTGSGTFTPSMSLTGGQVLIVAGGGGGGGATGSRYQEGGGGGAGGFIYNTGISLTAQTYTVTVGSGGTAGTSTAKGGNGGNSVFGSYTATGGGGAGSAYNNSTGVNGNSGGSGGGGARYYNSLYGTGGAGTSGQGNNAYQATTGAGGGGGGAAAAATSKNGANGLASTISGSSVYYAGGGGGGTYSGNGGGGTAGTGGNGGGGAGSSSGNGTAGTANTGGGGGGGATGTTTAARTGGAGGSGIVIVRYTMPAPTITTLGSTSGCVGSSITINGTNFYGIIAANVKIGGTAVSSITSFSTTQIIAIIGSGTSGTGNVTVTTVGGTATSTETFTETSPSITSHPSNEALIPGFGTSFSVVASGTPLTYQWQVSTNGGSTFTDITTAGTGPTYSGWNSATLALSGIIAGNNNYQYQCVVSINTCSATSNAATLTVLASCGTGGSQTFTTNGTFTVPANVTSLKVEAWGGGGAGGGVNGNTARSGGGGGGGAYMLAPSVVVTPSENLTVAVGAGGTGKYSSDAGGNGSGDGNNGAASTLSRGASALVTAAGGTGGKEGRSGQTNGPAGTGGTGTYNGGAGGVGTGTTPTFSGGGGGGAGSGSAGTAANGATGGSGGTGTYPGGAGANGRTSSSSGDGTSATALSGGGGGAFDNINTDRKGGDGYRGQVIVTYTIPDPEVTQPANQEVCNGNTTTAVNFSGSNGATQFYWTNNNTSIGLAAYGTGNIGSFTAVNTGSTPQVATITVTPSSGTCLGSTPKSFTFIVNPASVGGTATAAANALCASNSGTNISLTGSTGTIQWQKFNGTDWSNVGTTGDNPLPTGTLAADSYFRAVVTSGVCSSANSNTVGVYINPSYKWTGEANDNSWSNASNWKFDGGQSEFPTVPPISCSNVTIPNGCTYYPTTIPSTTSIVNLTLEDGASLMGNSNLTVSGTTTMIKNINDAGWYWHLLSSPVAAQNIWGDGDMGEYNFVPKPSGSGYSSWTWPVSGINWDFYYFNPKVTNVYPNVPWVNLRDAAVSTNFPYNYGEIDDVAPNGTGANAGFGQARPVFTPGRGYLVAYNTDYTTRHDFKGTLNSGNIPVTLNTTGSLYHLVGNPYPSALDWEDADWTRTGLASSENYASGFDFWIFQDGTGGGNYAIGNSAGNYTGNLSKYIPPMQGFFVKANSAGGSFEMTESVRAHSNQQWYKSITDQSHKIRLKITTDNNSFADEMIVDFKEQYSGEEGSEKFYSMYSAAPEIWSVKNGNIYTIDRYKGLTSSLSINISVKCGVYGTYTITSTGISEFELSNIVYLEDLKTGNKVNLKETGSYSFSGGPNDNKARFRITFAEITGTDVPEISKPVYIYSFGKDVYGNASSLTTGNCDVYIYDAPGRLVYNGKYTPVVGNHKFATLQTPGAYVVKVISHTGTTTAKIIIP